MISRRQIIESQQELKQRAAASQIVAANRVDDDDEDYDDDEFSSSSRAFVSRRIFKQQATMQQQLAPPSRLFNKSAISESSRRRSRQVEEDHEGPLQASVAKQRQAMFMAPVASDKHSSEALATRSHFDPYSVYGEEDEEEDVWYSEERLFEVSQFSQILSLIVVTRNTSFAFFLNCAPLRAAGQ